MSGGERVLSSEGGTKGVNVGQRAGIELALQSRHEGPDRVAEMPAYEQRPSVQTKKPHGFTRATYMRIDRATNKTPNNVAIPFKAFKVGQPSIQGQPSTRKESLSMQKRRNLSHGSPYFHFFYTPEADQTPSDKPALRRSPPCSRECRQAAS